MSDKVVFHLAKAFPPLTAIRPYLHCAETFYEQIKNGKKTSEWRDPTAYWLKRLVTKADLQVNGTEPQDLTRFLKVHRAWFVEGYPKGLLPRLETDIVGVIFHPEAKIFPVSRQQLEIKIANAKEVTS